MSSLNGHSWDFLIILRFGISKINLDQFSGFVYESYLNHAEQLEVKGVFSWASKRARAPINGFSGSAYTLGGVLRNNILSKFKLRMPIQKASICGGFGVWSDNT